MSENFLLDTGVLNAYLRGRPGAVALVDPLVQSGHAFTSIIVYGEIVEYLLGLLNYTQREAALRAILGDVKPWYLTYPIMRRYAQLRRLMRPPHGQGLVGDADTLIAATALEHNLTVMTIDKDFTRVPGLEVQVYTLRELRG